MHAYPACASVTRSTISAYSKHSSHASVMQLSEQLLVSCKEREHPIGALFPGFSYFAATAAAAAAAVVLVSTRWATSSRLSDLS